MWRSTGNHHWKNSKMVYPEVMAFTIYSTVTNIGPDGLITTDTRTENKLQTHSKKSQRAQFSLRVQHSATICSIVLQTSVFVLDVGVA